MEGYQREKQLFVAAHLGPTVAAATGGDVAGVEYAVEGGEEYVYIVFRRGYRKRRCVTGDSLKALCDDVLAILPG